MSSGGQGSYSFILRWNEEATLESFEQRVKLFVPSTKEERYLCGPRLLSTFDPEGDTFRYVRDNLTDAQLEAADGSGALMIVGATLLGGCKMPFGVYKKFLGYKKLFWGYKKLLGKFFLGYRFFCWFSENFIGDTETFSGYKMFFSGYNFFRVNKSFWLTKSPKHHKSYKNSKIKNIQQENENNKKKQNIFL